MFKRGVIYLENKAFIILKLIKLIKMKLWKILSINKTPIARMMCKRGLSVTSLSDYRSLISVRGPDSSLFLQNLTTNNIYQLGKESPVQYAMILNSRGRMMYDIIVYKHPTPTGNYLMELDSNCIEQAMKYFKLFRIKKKVDLTVENLNVYSVYETDADFKSENSLITVKDPRCADLGYRVILPKDETLPTSSDLRKYKKFLYQNGIAENSDDFSQANSIPLEYNIEFLNGVSFDKGCYLGQELVAKTHYTGVVRKRIMPIKLANLTQTKFEKDSVILNKNTGQNVGKLINMIEDNGIAMLRLANVDKDGIVILDSENNEHPVRVIIPNYWPLDDPILKDLKKF